jgi:circadian clock protein KaiB
MEVQNGHRILLRLYIVNSSGTNLDFITRLKSFISSSKNTYSLEIIEILKNPEQTLLDHILASPTLIKVFPLPTKRIVGNAPISQMIEQLEL